MMFIPALQPNDGFEWTQESWGPVLRCSPLGSVAQHVFTIGNLQLQEDEAEWVQVAGALAVRPEDLLLVRQVHGRDVAVARGGRDGNWTRPEADVIVSDDPRAAIGVRVADCAPILLADARTGAVGAAHGGWRGTIQRAAPAATEAMARHFGTRPRDLIAAIGPCLGPCCGEVGEEVVQAFRDAGHSAGDVARWFTPGPSGRPNLDLWGAHRDQLIGAGVPAAHIHVAALCTRSHPTTFHSYRAAGAAAGRMLGAIRCSRR